MVIIVMNFVGQRCLYDGCNIMCKYCLINTFNYNIEVAEREIKVSNLICQ